MRRGSKILAWVMLCSVAFPCRRLSLAGIAVEGALALNASRDGGRGLLAQTQVSCPSLPDPRAPQALHTTY